MNLTMSDLAVIAMLIVVLIVALTIVHRIRQAHRFARQWREHVERINTAPDVVQAQIKFDERRVRRQAAMEAWGKQVRGEIDRPGSHIGLDGQPVLHLATDPIPAVEPEANPLIGVRGLVPGAEPAPLPEGKIEVQHGLTPDNPDVPKEEIVPEVHPQPTPAIDANPLPEPFIPYRERMGGSGIGSSASGIQETGEGPSVVRITFVEHGYDAPIEPTQTGVHSDLSSEETSPPGFLTHDPVTAGGATPLVTEPTAEDPPAQPATGGEAPTPVTTSDAQPVAPQEPTRVVLLPKPWSDFKPPPGVTVVDVQPPPPPHVEIHPVFRPLPPGFVAQAERVRGNRVKRVRGRIVSDHPKPKTDTAKPEEPA